MIEGGRLPARSGVTGRTIRSKRAVVMVIFLMAGDTIFRRTSEYIIDMAIGTSRAAMLSSQREGRFAVIEGGGLPTRGGVTGCAILPKRALVEIIRGMTGITICGCAFELQVGMTFGTGNAVMLAGQFEDGVVVIKVARIPSARCMTVCTLIAKRAAMRVGVAVTGGTVRWRAFEQFICMALAACN